MGELTSSAHAPDTELLELLADGQFHSGSALGAAMGISRAAVWKRMQRLAELGLAVQSVKGRGYRLHPPPQLLDADRLERVVGDKADFHYLPVTESTNADALILAAEAPQRPAVFTAEYQHAGRGRRGRRWQSPYAANLYLSLLFSVPGGFSALGGLSLAAGTVLAETLASLYPTLSPQLKWPNDIWLHGKKLAGVLIEVAGEMDGQVHVVLGVGLNCRMNPGQAAEIDQPWTDLYGETGQMPDRTLLAERAIMALLEMAECFAEKGFAPYQRRFAYYDLCCGQEVAVQTGQAWLHGRAQGVTGDGALVLDTEQGRQLLHGGEVSLRVK